MASYSLAGNAHSLEKLPAKLLSCRNLEIKHFLACMFWTGGIEFLAAMAPGRLAGPLALQKPTRNPLILRRSGAEAWLKPRAG